MIVTVDITLTRGECRCRLAPKNRENISQHHKQCGWRDMTDTITLFAGTSQTRWWTAVLWYQPYRGPDPTAVVRRKRPDPARGAGTQRSTR